MNIYTVRYPVYTFLCDENVELTLPNLLGLSVEAALDHQNSVVDWEQEDRFWVLHSWQFHFLKPIKGGRTLKLRTWVSEGKGFFSFRQLDGWNEEDEMCFFASSRWLYLDRKRRRPVRIPKEIGESFGEHPQEHFAENPTMPKELGAPLISRFRVEKEDLDMNHHMNNAAYLEKALSTYSREFLLSTRPRALTIIYHQESLYQEELRMEQKRLEKTDYFYLYGEELRTQIALEWKE